MIYSVSSDNMDYKLCENDRIKSILQNISLIISTRKGSVPMYRGFGLPMKFIDKPANIADTLLLSEAIDAISTYEPRAEVIEAHVVQSSAAGKIIIKLGVEIQ